MTDIPTLVGPGFIGLAEDRRAGPKLQERLVKYFAYRFDELFDVGLVDPDSRREQVLEPRK